MPHCWKSHAAAHMRTYLRNCKKKQKQTNTKRTRIGPYSSAYHVTRATPTDTLESLSYIWWTSSQGIFFSFSFSFFFFLSFYIKFYKTVSYGAVTPFVKLTPTHGCVRNGDGARNTDNADYTPDVSSTIN